MEAGRFKLIARTSALALAVLALAVGLAAATKTSKVPSNLSPQNRLAIVRFLAFEYATARQPMPASKAVAEALIVDASGQVNQDKLREDLAKRGAAIYTGEKIQITKIEFFNNRIIFEINGGGKRKKKWTERIQIEAGGSGIPVPTVEKTPEDPGAEPIRAGFGSWVTLAFPEGLPDLTAEQVKGLLGGVLDFEAQSSARAWIETIPEQFREPIKERRAIAGMNREMVLAAKGRPDKKVRETRDGVEYEDWIYGNPPFTIFVVFVGDTVVEVKEFK